MKDDIDLYKKQSITEATELHSAVVGEVEDLRTKLQEQLQRAADEAQNGELKILQKTEENKALM